MEARLTLKALGIFAVLLVATVGYVFFQSFDGRQGVVGTERSACHFASKQRAADVNNLRADIYLLRIEATANRGTIAMGLLADAQDEEIARKRDEIFVDDHRIDPAQRDRLIDPSDRRIARGSGYSCVRAYPDASLLGSS